MDEFWMSLDAYWVSLRSSPSLVLVSFVTMGKRAAVIMDPVKEAAALAALEAELGCGAGVVPAQPVPPAGVGAKPFPYYNQVHNVMVWARFSRARSGGRRLPEEPRKFLPGSSMDPPKSCVFAWFGQDLVVPDRAAGGCPKNPAGFWPGSSVCIPHH